MPCAKQVQGEIAHVDVGPADGIGTGYNIDDVHTATPLVLIRLPGIAPLAFLFTGAWLLVQVVPDSKFARQGAGKAVDACQGRPF